jgi:hypothetical protein
MPDAGASCKVQIRLRRIQPQFSDSGSLRGPNESLKLEMERQDHGFGADASQMRFRCGNPALESKRRWEIQFVTGV